MKLDIYGNPIYNSSSLFDKLYQGHDIENNSIIVSYSSEIEQLLDIVPNITYSTMDEYMPVDLVDKYNQLTWFIPEKYQTFDILEYCISKCRSDIELERVAAEYLAFEERNLGLVLKWAKYFVDTCTEHNVLWGVGRGSSVSSYLLFILGVHKVDSLKYDLDYNDFLR